MQKFNYEIDFSIEPKGASASLIHQVHGAKVVTIGDGGTCPEADGVFAADSLRPLYVFTADCLPVILFTARKNGPIAALHAGWRGTKDGVVQEGLKFFFLPEVQVAIGPGIGPCCFEVKEDFLLSFETASRNPRPFYREGKFDLLGFLLANDLKAIPKERVHLELHRCTVCSSPRLPSYRRDKGTDPRIKTWIKQL